MNHRLDRRRIMLGVAATMLSPGVFSQTGHGAHHEGQYESLNKPGRMGLPEQAAMQHVFDSPAPRATQAGKWMAREALPLPRSEMAWAVAYGGKMHLVGGYGEQRVDRPYHQVYDPQADRWSDAAALPRVANHVGVAVLDGKLHAVGGHQEQNRKPHDACFFYDGASDRWQQIASLPWPCGAVACVGLGAAVLGDAIHVAGGGTIMGGGVQSALHEAFTLG